MVQAIESMNALQLRAKCREAGIRNYSKMRAAEMREELTRTETKGRASAVKTFKEPQFAEVKGDDQPVFVERRRAGSGPTLLSLLGLESIVPPKHTTVIQVIDGKKRTVEIKNAAPKAAQTSAQRRKEERELANRTSTLGVKIEKVRDEKNGVKRPSKGTVCRAVWDVLDRTKNATSKDLAGIAEQNGWNKTNVVCEFYNWRKFNGIKGRASK